MKQKELKSKIVSEKRKRKKNPPGEMFNAQKSWSKTHVSKQGSMKNKAKFMKEFLSLSLSLLAYVSNK